MPRAGEEKNVHHSNKNRLLSYRPSLSGKRLRVNYGEQWINWSEVTHHGQQNPSPSHAGIITLFPFSFADVPTRFPMA